MIFGRVIHNPDRQRIYFVTDSGQLFEFSTVKSIPDKIFIGKQDHTVEMNKDQIQSIMEHLQKWIETGEINPQ